MIGELSEWIFPCTSPNRPIIDGLITLVDLALKDNECMRQINHHDIHSSKASRSTGSVDGTKTEKAPALEAATIPA